MNIDLKSTLLISLAFHAALFFATSIQARKTVYLTIPVELMFSQPAPAPEAPAVAQPKEKDEIPVPSKKPAAKPVKPVPKETPKPVEEKPVQPENTGAGGSTGATLQPASQLTLEAARFPFAYYTNIVVKKINRNWQWSTQFDRLKTVVYFHITRQGDVSLIDIRESSGDQLFDQQAVRAIRLSDPFPPLPEAWEDDYLGVYFEFTFKQ